MTAIDPLESSADTSSLSDPRQRQIGTANRDNIRRALNSLALFPLTKRLGMSIDEVNNLVERASVDAVNPALKAYFPV